MSLKTVLLFWQIVLADMFVLQGMIFTFNAVFETNFRQYFYFKYEIVFRIIDCNKDFASLLL